VYTSLGYGPIIKYLKYFAARHNIDLVQAKADIPVKMEQLNAAVEHAITPNTKLVIVDHITSSTGLVLELEKLIGICRAKSVLPWFLVIFS